jgi:maleate isomerase
VFIGGNALRAIGVIAALEEDVRRPVRRPVLTANQVSLRYALRAGGAEVRVDDYVQLFKMPCRQPDIPST